jgi:hypothetical protein
MKKTLIAVIGGLSLGAAPGEFEYFSKQVPSLVDLAVKCGNKTSGVARTKGYPPVPVVSYVLKNLDNTASFSFTDGLGGTPNGYADRGDVVGLWSNSKNISCLVGVSCTNENLSKEAQKRAIKDLKNFYRACGKSQVL